MSIHIVAMTSYVDLVRRESQIEWYDRMQLESRWARLVESGDRVVDLEEAFSNVFAQQPSSTGVHHPNKAQPSKDLPKEYCSYAGFLLWDTSRVIPMD